MTFSGKKKDKPAIGWQNFARIRLQAQVCSYNTALYHVFAIKANSQRPFINGICTNYEKLTPLVLTTLISLPLSVQTHHNFQKSEVFCKNSSDVGI